MTPYNSDKSLDGINAITNNKGTFALVNKREITKEGATTYVADKIPIDRMSDADEAIKNYNLSTLLTENGFYADDKSRADLSSALLIKLCQSLDRDEELLVPGWKKKDGVVLSLTIGDALDAVRESLTKKGEIVGVV